MRLKSNGLCGKVNEIKATKYSDLHIGQFAEVTHTITEEDIQTFGDLSGDYNPLHFDEEWAKTTIFNGRIAHGLLTASYISTVIGMKLPGPGTIYLGQNMNFMGPVRIGDTLTARVEVASLNDEKQRVTLKTLCTNQNQEVVIEGDALIKIMSL